jgi:hypothetical protein
VGMGISLACLTAIKPWWFWWHAKALLLRDLIGDRATTFVYLAIAAWIAATGLYRAKRIADARDECRVLWHQASSSHDRMPLLQHVPGSRLPHVGSIGSAFYSCGDFHARGEL